MREFERTQQELLSSRTVEAYNQSLYLLASDANSLMGRMVDSIYFLNTERMPASVQRLYVDSVNVLFVSIQTSFGIPAQAVQTALDLRLQKLFTDDRSLKQAALIRAPLGFDVVGREKTASGGDQIIQQHLGFVHFKDSAKESPSPQKSKIGFIHFKEKSDSLPVEKIQMGFIKTPESDGEIISVGKQPIGYVHFKDQLLTSESATKHILLDLDTGYFEVQ